MVNRGGAPLGNTNAAKPPELRRRTISIRLPPELLEKLADEPDKTALIERLLRQHYDIDPVEAGVGEKDGC